MLPIATVQGVKDGISTGMIVDLSEYLKKIEGVSKEEHEKLEAVVSTKLDAEPQHNHHIEDIKQLQNVLDDKFDKGEKYSYNVILNDTEKIPYFENPKIQLMELVKNKETEGYKFYVDENSGDLMIILNDVLVGTYSKSGGKWTLNGVESGAPVNHTHTTIDNGLTINGTLIVSGIDILNEIDRIQTVFEEQARTISLAERMISEQQTTLSSQATKITSLESDNAYLLSKIPEMEAVLQNHYQALMLMLRQHDMVDTDDTDGSNITPATSTA